MPARTVRFESTSIGLPFSSYSWNFGDGSANGSGSTVDHTFPAGSSFVVTLTVVNATGTNTTTRTVSMAASVASFTDAPGTPVRTVDFTNTSTAGPFSSIRWDFGDGSTGTGATTSHRYADSGATYDVVLTVTNGLGTYTVTRSITS